MENKICLLGLRGSIPVSGPDFTEFGHATSCMLVYSTPDGGQGPTHAVVIDAGTGLLNVRKNLPQTVKKLTILISHVHLDHIQGLLMMPEMFSGELDIDIYCGMHEGGDFKTHLRALMKPPVWPVTPAYFAGNVRFLKLPETEFKIEDISVSSIQGSHPDGIDVFKLTMPDGKVMVHVGDYEVGQNREIDERLKAFVKGSQLLLMDGMYTPDEYESQRGFGHSSWEITAALASEAGLSRTKIIHHAPGHTDEMLRNAEKELQSRFPGASLGREGEVILL